MVKEQKDERTDENQMAPLEDYTSRLSIGRDCIIRFFKAVKQSAIFSAISMIAAGSHTSPGCAADRSAIACLIGAQPTRLYALLRIDITADVGFNGLLAEDSSSAYR